MFFDLSNLKLVQFFTNKLMHLISFNVSGSHFMVDSMHPSSFWGCFWEILCLRVFFNFCCSDCWSFPLEGSNCCFGRCSYVLLMDICMYMSHVHPVCRIVSLLWRALNYSRWQCVSPRRCISLATTLQYRCSDYNAMIWLYELGSRVFLYRKII